MQLLTSLFLVHDALTDFLVRHMQGVKRGMLIIAHLTLFGFFFPELRNTFGEQAFNILFFLLFLSPLSKILRMRLLLILMSYRRQMGILMAYLATIHGIGYLADPLWFEFLIAPYFPGDIAHIEPRLLAGILAYALTLPLLFTSNDFANRILGKNWKRLHTLVYGVFVLAVFHKFTVAGGFADAGAITQAVALILFYILLKSWAFTGAPHFLQSLVARIALQYQEYTAQRKTSNSEPLPS